MRLGEDIHPATIESGVVILLAFAVTVGTGWAVSERHLLVALIAFVSTTIVALMSLRRSILVGRDKGDKAF